MSHHKLSIGNEWKYSMLLQKIYKMNNYKSCVFLETVLCRSHLSRTVLTVMCQTVYRINRLYRSFCEYGANTTKLYALKRST